MGQRYPFPTGSEPSASFQAQGADLYLLMVDDQGCYKGKTRLPRDVGYTPVRVVPNQPLMIESDGEVVMTVSFTPREKGRYWLTSADGPLESNPDETFFQSIMRGKRRVHIMSVTEMDEATQQLKPVKLKQLFSKPKSLTCIKLG